jgi:hypothetical protein
MVDQPIDNLQLKAGNKPVSQAVPHEGHRQMTQRELASEILAVRSRGPKGSWVQVIDPATSGLIAPFVLLARGSRSPPG